MGKKALWDAAKPKRKFDKKPALKQLCKSVLLFGHRVKASRF